MADFPIDIKIDTSSAQKLGPLNSQLDQTDTKATAATTATTALSRAFVVLGGAAVAGRALRTVANFSQEMSTVTAITGGTEKQVKSLRQEITALGASTRFSASEAAQGASFLARAGFDTNQILNSLGDTLLLAQAGALGLAEAADIASNVLTGFRLPAEQAGRVVDVLALAANRANTDVSQLGSAMSMVAPIASGLRISVEATSAAISALSDAGIQGTAAGTGLRRVLSTLESPTDTVRRQLRALGIEAEDVKVSQVGLVAAMSRLRDAGVDTGNALEIFGDRGGPAFEVLSNSIPRVVEMTAALENADGFARRVADTMDDNLNGALLAARSATEGLVLALGDLGAETVATDGARGLAAAIRGLTENIETVVGVAGVAAVALGARLLSSLTASTVGTIKKTLATSANAAATATSAAQELKFLRVTQLSLVAQLRSSTVSQQQASIRGQLAANTLALVAAEQRLTTAQAASTLTQRGVAASLTAIGGPVGIAAATTFAIYKLSQSYRDGLQAQEDRTKRIMDEFKAQQKLNKELEKAGLLFEDTATATATGATAMQRYASDVDNAFRTAVAAMSQDELQDQIDGTTKALEQSERRFERVSAQFGEGTLRYKQAEEAVRKYKAELEVLNARYPHLTTRSTQATEALTKVTQALEGDIHKLREQAGLLEANAVSYELLTATREAGVELGTEEAAELERLLALRAELTETLRAQQQAESAQQQADRTIEALQRQSEALQLTGEEQAVFNALAGLSADVTDGQREAIEALTRSIYAQNEALQAQRNVEEFDKGAETAIERLEREAEEIREANRRITEEGLQDKEEQAARELAIDEKLAADKLRLRQQSDSAVRQASAQGLDALAGIIEAGAGKQNAAYRAVFAASRAFALADSIAKLSQAQAQALADPTAVTLPQKIANYAAVATAGAGLLSSLKSPAGFKDGGFTGNIGVDDIAGVVHGQEFVMPAAQTKQYRNELEAMRSGSGGTRNASGGITIINNAPDRVAVTATEDSNGDMIATIDARIAETVPNIIAGEAADPYSNFTKSVNSRYRLERN